MRKRNPFFGVISLFSIIVISGCSANIRLPRQSNRPPSNCAGFGCGSGECIERDQLCNGFNDCSDGSDESGCSSKQPVCSPLLHNERSIRCIYLGKEIPCNVNMPIGTRAEIKCNLRNEYLEARSTFYQFCLSNGQWLSQNIDCNVECGGTSNNNEARDITRPWNALVTRRTNKGTYIACMATIVSAYAVLTNPRCTLHPDLSTINSNDLKVVIGKGFGVLAQYDVEHIHFHGRYRRTNTFYELALLELKRKINFNDDVKPVCIHKDVKTITSYPQRGTMVTFADINYTVNLAQLVLVQGLLYMNARECMRFLSSNNIVTLLDLCGRRTRDERSANLVTNGAGLTSEFNDAQYLYGIQRSMEKNGNDEIYVYGDLTVDFNVQFLRSRLANITNKFVRMCPPIYSTASVTASCDFEGTSITCDTAVRPGTVARVTCNEGYTFASFQSRATSNFCKDDGTWALKADECVPDCGIFVENKQTASVRPWSATIFDKTNDTIYWINCLGTLVTPYAVVSAASCAFKRDSPFDLRPVIGLKVVVGNRFADIPNAEDANSQSIDVEKVHIPQMYDRSNVNTSDFNIAVFELIFPVTISSNVLPICRGIQLPPSSNGLVTLWDLDRSLPENRIPTQLVAPVSFLTYENCIRSASRDVNIYRSMFCARDISNADKKIPHAWAYDKGGGATFLSNGRHYLVGINPHDSFTDRNDNNIEYFKLFDYTRNRQVSSFIDDRLNFITEKHRIPTGKCQIPSASGTKYSRRECTNYDTCESENAGEFVDADTVIHITCADGYAYPLESIGEVHLAVCYRGNWLPKNISCVRLCPPLSSSSTFALCVFESKQDDCSSRVRPDTIAYTYCSAGYIISAEGETSIGNNTSVCKNDGTWNPEPQKCFQNCGLHAGQVAQVSGGSKANRKNHPWNVGIYLNKRDNSLGTFEMKQTCGGTIVAEFTVISAAHCFHKDTTYRGEKHPMKDLMVGAGKTYRAFNHPNDADSAQYVGVRDVVFQDTYKGNSNTGYAWDVAIVVLARRLIFNSHVIPVCVDSKNQLSYFVKKNNELGVVVGWGFNGTRFQNNRVSTDTLHIARLPYYSYEECLQAIKNNNLDISELTDDKFCAFYEKENATSVQPGDSGAGIIFPINNRHYIYGVVSTQISNDDASLSTVSINTFTNITATSLMKFVIGSLNSIQINMTGVADPSKGPNQCF